MQTRLDTLFSLLRQQVNNIISKADAKTMIATHLQIQTHVQKHPKKMEKMLGNLVLALSAYIQMQSPHLFNDNYYTSIRKQYWGCAQAFCHAIKPAKFPHELLPYSEHIIYFLITAAGTAIVDITQNNIDRLDMLHVLHKITDSFNKEIHSKNKIITPYVTLLSASLSYAMAFRNHVFSDKIWEKIQSYFNKKKFDDIRNNNMNEKHISNDEICLALWMQTYHLCVEINEYNLSHESFSAVLDKLIKTDYSGMITFLSTLNIQATQMLTSPLPFISMGFNLYKNLAEIIHYFIQDAELFIKRAHVSLTENEMQLVKKYYLALESFKDEFYQLDVIKLYQEKMHGCTTFVVETEDECLALPSAEVKPHHPIDNIIGQLQVLSEQSIQAYQHEETKNAVERRCYEFVKILENMPNEEHLLQHLFLSIANYIGITLKPAHLRYYFFYNYSQCYFLKSVIQANKYPIEYYKYPEYVLYGIQTAVLFNMRCYSKNPNSIYLTSLHLAKDAIIKYIAANKDRNIFHQAALMLKATLLYLPDFINLPLEYNKDNVLAPFLDRSGLEQEKSQVIFKLSGSHNLFDQCLLYWFEIQDRIIRLKKYGLIIPISDKKAEDFLNFLESIDNKIILHQENEINHALPGKSSGFNPYIELIYTTYNLIEMTLKQLNNLIPSRSRIELMTCNDPEWIEAYDLLNTKLRILRFHDRFEMVSPVFFDSHHLKAQHDETISLLDFMNASNNAAEDKSINLLDNLHAEAKQQQDFYSKKYQERRQKLIKNNSSGAITSMPEQSDKHEMTKPEPVNLSWKKLMDLDEVLFIHSSVLLKNLQTTCHLMNERLKNNRPLTPQQLNYITQIFSLVTNKYYQIHPFYSKFLALAPAVLPTLSAEEQEGFAIGKQILDETIAAATDYQQKCEVQYAELIQKAFDDQQDFLYSLGKELAGENETDYQKIMYLGLNKYREICSRNKKLSNHGIERTMLQDLSGSIKTMQFASHIMRLVCNHQSLVIDHLPENLANVFLHLDSFSHEHCLYGSKVLDLALELDHMPSIDSADLDFVSTIDSETLLAQHFKASRNRNGLYFKNCMAGRIELSIIEKDIFTFINSQIFTIHGLFCIYKNGQAIICDTSGKGLADLKQMRLDFMNDAAKIKFLSDPTAVLLLMKYLHKKFTASDGVIALLQQFTMPTVYDKGHFNAVMHSLLSHPDHRVRKEYIDLFIDHDLLFKMFNIANDVGAEKALQQLSARYNAGMSMKHQQMFGKNDRMESLVEKDNHSLAKKMG